MSNNTKYRVRGMGMDREIERKLDKKYSLDDENELMEWIIAVLSLPPESEHLSYPEGVGKEYFQDWLKDGIILCELMNKLCGERVCKPHMTHNVKLLAMRRNKEMENIGFFLKAAANYGVKPIDLFQTVCLYESTNLAQVQATLFKLGSEAISHDFDGPTIGVKVSQTNYRNFEENKLQEGRNIIGLQMGTNQVASQQGMTPYGLGRQLVSKSDH
ncbi:transgelin-2-like [Styela clava]|uniref:LOW QUALITY PROTEIN: transgelin-2-like n=1 Tax=Styela clava TaxID=7725 RepID=UPI001939AD45|nr:LOW QUALITY PROTEIN: transgelin-2-like [Styela clava]